MQKLLQMLEAFATGISPLTLLGQIPLVAYCVAMAYFEAWRRVCYRPTAYAPYTLHTLFVLYIQR